MATGTTGLRRGSRPPGWPGQPRDPEPGRDEHRWIGAPSPDGALQPEVPGPGRHQAGRPTHDPPRATQIAGIRPPRLLPTDHRPRAGITRPTRPDHQAQPGCLSRQHQDHRCGAGPHLGTDSAARTPSHRHAGYRCGTETTRTTREAQTALAGWLHEDLRRGSHISRNPRRTRMGQSQRLSGYHRSRRTGVAEGAAGM